jgi:hypothetical protein
MNMKPVEKQFSKVLLKWMVFLSIILSLPSHAQGVKRIQAGIGAGFAPTWSFGESSSASNLGILFIEPRYVRGHHTFALRGEMALLYSESIGVVYHRSFQAGKKVIPFVGLGVGYFHRFFHYDADPFGFKPTEARNIGFFPRAGLRFLNRFELIADYNLVSTADNTPLPSNPTVNFHYNASYLGIKFCAVINSGK